MGTGQVAPSWGENWKLVKNVSIVVTLLFGGGGHGSAGRVVVEGLLFESPSYVQGLFLFLCSGVMLDDGYHMCCQGFELSWSHKKQTF